MKNKEKKIAIGLLSFLAIILVGYLVFTQYYNEERIKSEVVALLEEMLPGSDVAIESINISYGPSVTVKGRGLTSHYFDVKTFTLRLPIASLLAGGGNVEILFRDTKLQFKSQTSRSPPQNKVREITIPSFLANSSGSFRFENLHISYIDDGLEQEFQVDRFILKNVGLRSNAAFEVKSHVSWEGDRSQFNSNLYIIGSFNVAHYVKKQVLPFNANFKLNDIEINQKKNIFSTINGRLGFTLNSDGLIEGGAEAFHQNSNIQLNGEFGANTLNLKKLAFHLEGNELMPLSKSLFEIAQGPRGLIDGVGALKWNKEKFSPDMDITFSGIHLPWFREAGPFSGELKGNSNKVSLYAYAKMKDGKLNIESKIDLNSNEEELHKLIERLELGFIFENVALKEVSLMRDISLSKWTKNEEGEYVLLPHSKIYFEAKDSSLKGFPIDGLVTLKAYEDKIAVVGRGSFGEVSENFILKNDGLFHEKGKELKQLKDENVLNFLFKDKLWQRQ